MGRLHVAYRLGLTYGAFVLPSDQESPIVISYPETGNSVQIDVPQLAPATELAGPHPQVVVHVTRQCTDDEGLDGSYGNAMRLGIPTDAGRAFWSLLEIVREMEFRGQSATGFYTIVGYPVTPAEEIQDNPLVRTCHAEWTYEEQETIHSTLGAAPTFSVTDTAWRTAAVRMANRESVLAHVSFGLDAVYYANFDPLRAIIMACASWETALRYYLSNVASQADVAYVRAAKAMSIPRLYQSAMMAKGGPVFHDLSDPGLAEFVRRERDCIKQLPKLRNKLLHEGNRAIPAGAANDTSLAVLRACNKTLPQIWSGHLADLAVLRPGGSGQERGSRLATCAAR